MRVLTHAILVAAALLAAGPAPAQEASPVPERRTVLTPDTDFYGSDLRQIFDTTLEACQQACLAESACQAFTFNTRSGACFPKGAVSQQQPYQGAVSGWVRDAAPGAVERARARAAELAFLTPADLEQARAQAEGLAVLHVTGDWEAEELLESARAERAQGNLLAASRFQGAALNLTDAADQWAEYARLLLDAATPASGEQQQLNERAFLASVNGYLRAEAAPLRATALSVMAQALERAGRGREVVAALRLAQFASPRDDIATALADAIGKYGFRITEHQIESDTAEPAVCAVFSEEIADADPAPFLRLPESGLAAEASGNRLCITGVSHGSRYQITFREGLPAASGETLAQDTTLSLYIRDRTAAVRFPGRAYVLPRAAGAGVPVETVNATELELTLYRVSGRNLIRTIQNDWFGRSLDYWSLDYLGSEIAEEVWTGMAEVAMEVNRDLTTRLPLEQEAGPLAPGIYALRAAIPGQDIYDHPPAVQWFVVSDLGMTSMSGTDGLHVFVRSLADASAKAGVRAVLLSRANSVLGTVETDAEGYAHFPAGLTSGAGSSAPAVVMVEEGEADMAFLPLTDPEFDLSDRGVEGREPAPPIDVFLTTDRGAYRAGEVVNVTALTRDGRAGAIEGMPLTAVLIRPDGVEYSRHVAQDAGGGGHVFALPVAGAAPRGTWRLELYADPDAPMLASRTFLVEDFLPERIDFALALPEGALRLGDIPELSLAARYLFGAPGADLAVEGEYRISAAAALDGFPGFRFGRQDEPFSPWMDSFASGLRTDAAGEAQLLVALPEIADPGRPLDLTLTVRVAEGSGRPVERAVTKRLLPGGPVIGLRPLFEGNVAPEGSEAGFEVVAIGPDGSAAPLEARWTVNRLEHRYQWYSLYGQWNWEVTTSRTRVAGGALSLTGAGPQAIAAPLGWGNYELVVEAAGPDATASASMEFYAGWYAPADATQTPDTLELSLDKPAYRPGETARVRLVPRSAGVALVTVVSNRLIDMRAVPVTEGENTLDLPVTEDWGAGAYVAASVLRPLDGAAERLPARALGLAHAAVEPGKRRLAAAFETPAEADPRGPLPVALKVEGVEPGETAWATIAAVDLGILNLTAFASPDPEGHYFGQRKLGMAIRDLYGRLIDGQSGALGALRSGGDAGRDMRLQAPPPTEELVAYFSGPVEVGADGYARAEFRLPSFNGTVRLMAVAWSKTGVGQAEAEVLVRDPVVVTASVPRFLAPGDESRLLLEIVHAAGPAGRMGLDVTAEGLELGSAPSGLDLAEGGKATLSVPVTAGAAEGIETIRVALTTPEGRQLVKTLTVPVQANDPEIARRNRFTLAAGQSFTLDANVFAGLVPGTGKATVAMGPIARFDAPGLLAALDRYPYGCTEQITSRALPLLYFEDVARAVGVAGDDRLRGRIEEAIAEVLTNQSSNGAFGLWRPDSGDLWLDAYVSDFLSRARAQGFAVPDVAFRNAMDNLRNQVNYAADFDEGGGAIAYALMVLAREGAAAVGDLRYYADVKGEAFDTPIAAAQLGAALASYGDQTRADAMFARAMRLMTEARARPEAQLWRADYGTVLRDAAAVLALASEAGSEAVSRETLAAAVAEGAAGRRLSTQEATWSLLATHALIDRPGGEGFTVDGDPVTGPLVRVLEDQTAGGVETIIANGSGQETVLTLTTFGVSAEPEPAGGNGYAIERHYYTLDGEPADVSAVAQGTRLVAVVEITPYAGGEARLIVDDPLPAGFEIDNPNLIRGGDVAALDWLDAVEEVRMAEFRQDRFLAAVDWTSNRPFRLAYIVRAVSPGTFHHPAASVEDMYRPDYRGHGPTGRVTVGG